MRSLSSLRNHADVSITEKSDILIAGNTPSNFFLALSRADVLNYARSGNDLVIEFKDGQTLKLKSFFAYGPHFHNLVFIDGQDQFLVNFDQALSREGDGIDDPKVAYQELKDHDSVKALLGLLGGAAGAGAIALGASSSHDDKPDFDIDHTAPVTHASLVSISDDTGHSSSDFVTNDNTLIYTIRVDGPLDAGDTVWLRIVGPDGKAGAWLSAHDNGDGTYSVDHNADAYRLADGNYRIETVVRDRAGNYGPVSGRAVTVDTSKPDYGDISITSYFDDKAPATGDYGPGSHTNDTSPLLKGTAAGLKPGDYITIYQDGVSIGTATVDDDGTWSDQLHDLADGRHSYQAVITNIAGNEGKISTQFDLTVDTVALEAPVITSVMDNTGPDTGPITSGDVTDELQPEVSGTGEAGTKVIIRDGDTVIASVLVDSHDKWTWKPEKHLAEGTHHLSVIGFDQAGNESKPSDAFDFIINIPVTINTKIDHFIDDNGSNIYDRLPSGSYTDDTTPTLHGTISDELRKNSTVAVYRGEKWLGNATVNGKKTGVLQIHAAI